MGLKSEPPRLQGGALSMKLCSDFINKPGSSAFDALLYGYIRYTQYRMMIFEIGIQSWED